ncbi:MAG: carbohydrate-binding domain-containing protein [Bacteroidales bacterium]|nr:carbohydrate-binding domain-containing protein [Bacteroidales bacterium]
MKILFLSLATALLLVGCSTGNNYDWSDIAPSSPGTSGSGTTSDDGNSPDFDPVISAWDGQKATDSASDAVGSDKDFYHELNTFSNTVTVTYSGSSATVSSTNSQILTNVTGAYVTIDMATNDVDKTEIILKGTSTDGGLKVYGASKFKLTLDGVDLTSQIGPAINSQCKKRIYVDVADGTENSLVDCSKYSNDPYYLSGSSADDEDRKGCFFSEGNLIFSGTGVLQITGNKKHGLCTDGYIYVRPGVTLVVNNAVKNAIHVKGDTDDGIGVRIMGGLIYAYTNGTAGKGIKCDYDIDIQGGTLQLNTAGGSEYDSDEKDTSSPAGLKSDTNIYISGGTLTLKSTGTGGKGINADGKVSISGGTTTVTTTGGKFTYSQSLTSSPKGVRAEGNIDISGGVLNISVTGQSDSSEGLESKASMTISGGDVYVWAYEDAINASSAFTVTGGRVYAYSSANDGIDSNGSLTISGGLVIGVGGSSPEGGIDCDSSSRFLINGGTVIGMGGTLQSSPSSSSKQRVFVLNSVSISKGTNLALLDPNGSPLVTFTIPRTLSSGNYTVSCADITSGSTYTLSYGGTLTDTTTWNGCGIGGTWTDGTSLGTITSSSVITTSGGSGSMGGGGNMGGGGHMGWW